MERKNCVNRQGKMLLLRILISSLFILLAFPSFTIGADKTKKEAMKRFKAVTEYLVEQNVMKYKEETKKLEDTYEQNCGRRFITPPAISASIPKPRTLKIIVRQPKVKEIKVPSFGKHDFIYIDSVSLVNPNNYATEIAVDQLTSDLMGIADHVGLRIRGRVLHARSSIREDYYGGKKYKRWELFTKYEGDLTPYLKKGPLRLDLKGTNLYLSGETGVWKGLRYTSYGKRYTESFRYIALRPKKPGPVKGPRVINTVRPQCGWSWREDSCKKPAGEWTYTAEGGALAVQVSGIGLYRDLPMGVKPAPDTILTLHNGPIEFLPFLRARDGEKEFEVRQGLTRFDQIGYEIKGTGFGFSYGHGREYDYRLTPLEAGAKTEFTVFAEGAKALSRTVTLAAGSVQFLCHGKELGGYRLPAGPSHEVELVLRSPVDIPGYSVKWDVARGNLMQVTKKKTSFSREGDTYVSRNTVRIPISDFKEAAVKGDRDWFARMAAEKKDLDEQMLSYHIYAPDGRIAYGGARDFWPEPPAIEGLQIKAARGNETPEPGPFDLFLVPAETGLQVSAELQLEGEMKVERPVRKGDFIRLQGDGTGRLEFRGNRLCPANNAAPGKAQVRLVAAPFLIPGKHQHEKKTLTFKIPKGKKLIASNPLKVTVNRLYLIAGPSGETVRLAVDGPADMGAYRAKWFLGSGRIEATGFHRAGKGWETEIAPRKGEGLRFVQLRDRRGNFIAELHRGGLDEIVTALDVRGPPFYKEGEFQDFTADVWTGKRLPAWFWDRAYCRWSVDKKYGDVTWEGPLLKLGPHHGRCDARVLFWEDAKNVGKEPEVGAELMLRQGGGK